MSKATIYVGDNRDLLKQLPDKSVQTVVTSPPYWGLRDYGTATWIGGDESCTHRRESKKSDKTITGHKNFTEMLGVGDAIYKDECPRCGAVRQDDQIGLESTPDEYVEQMCLVFDEIYRVLADDGTIWVNLGDSYSSVHSSGERSENSIFADTNYGQAQAIRQTKGSPSRYGLKQKELVGVPWRFAFAMQQRGWYLRQDIIWAKPNPMPESVLDRCTKSHEYIFLMTKQPRYFFDNEAIKEEAVTDPVIRNRASESYQDSFPGGRFSDGERMSAPGDGKRNKRDVWNVATRSYKEAHFATYPTELITPCVMAGTTDHGVCVSCGLSWTRITERATPPQVDDSELDRYGDGSAGVHRKVGQAYQNWLNENPQTTVGWQKPCTCETNEVKPAIVLDPFSGSGTTGEVALAHGRDYIGLELNPEYAALSDKRITNAIGMFGEVEIIG
jgi:site-specific DNA-methyltransferase (cytosine-N4-specific)